ncbi:MAG: DeoR family transcriptional regulator [bacterium]
MDKNHIIQLTNNLYRITLFFPKKEPLRYKMREVAASFLASPNNEDLVILDNFFEISLAQNWVSPSDILAIRQDYGNLRALLENEEIIPQQTLPQIGLDESKDSSSSSPFLGSENNSFQHQSGLTERQEKIIAFLKENGRAQVWQLKEILPEVTKRTLRRDFEGLLHNSKIERIGEKNNTFYQLKSRTA